MLGGKEMVLAKQMMAELITQQPARTSFRTMELHPGIFARPDRRDWLPRPSPHPPASHADASRSPVRHVVNEIKTGSAGMERSPRSMAVPLAAEANLISRDVEVRHTLRMQRQRRRDQLLVTHTVEPIILIGDEEQEDLQYFAPGLPHAQTAALSMSL